MRIAIYIVFGISVTVAAMLAVVPGLLIIAALSFMVVGPLGFVIMAPLLAIPTIALYSGLLMPWALTSPSSARSRLWLVGSLTAIAMVAAGLPLLSWATFQWQAATVAWTDTGAVPPPAIQIGNRHVELVGPIKKFRRVETKPDHELAPCSHLCQSLLAERLAGTVTVTSTRRRAKRRRLSKSQRRAGESRYQVLQKTWRVSYKLEPRTNCSPALPNYPKPLPITAARRAQGLCFVIAPATSALPDLQFAHKEVLKSHRHKRSAAMLQRARRRGDTTRNPNFLLGRVVADAIEVSNPADPQTGVFFRRTQLNAEPLRFPFAIVPSASLSSSSGNGLFVWRAKARAKAFDFETLVLHWSSPPSDGVAPQTPLRPGTRPEPAPLAKYETIAKRLEKRHDVDRAQILTNLLSRPGTGEFDKAAHEVLNRWVGPLRRQRQLNASELTIVKGIIRDQRFTDLTQVGFTIKRFPHQFNSDLPALLNRLAVKTPEARGHSHSSLAYAIAQMPPEDLRLHADRIIAIAEDEDRWHMGGLLKIVGQLGRDTSGLLRTRLNSTHSSTARAAIIGICRSDNEVARPLIPDLLAGLRDAVAGHGRRGDSLRAYALALIRHGHSREVNNLLDSLPEQKQRGRVRKRDLERGENFDPRYCR